MELSSYLIAADVQGPRPMELVFLELAGVPSLAQEREERSIAKFVGAVDEMHMLNGTLPAHLVPLPLTGVNLLVVE